MVKLSFLFYAGAIIECACMPAILPPPNTIQSQSYTLPSTTYATPTNTSPLAIQLDYPTMTAMILAPGMQQRPKIETNKRPTLATVTPTVTPRPVVQTKTQSRASSARGSVRSEAGVPTPSVRLSSRFSLPTQSVHKRDYEIRNLEFRVGPGRIADDGSV